MYNKEKEFLENHLKTRVQPREFHCHEKSINKTTSFIYVDLKIDHYKEYSISKDINCKTHYPPHNNDGQIICGVKIKRQDPSDDCIFTTISSCVNMTTGKVYE